MNATGREQIVEEILAIFDALDTTDSEAEGGRGSQREAVEWDLKRVDLQDLESHLWTAERIIEGLLNASESMGMGTQMVFSDCHNRVLRAHELAVRALGEDW